MDKDIWISGYNTCFTIIKHKTVKRILVSQDFYDKNIKFIKQANIKPEIYSYKQINKIIKNNDVNNYSENSNSLYQGIAVQISVSEFIFNNIEDINISSNKSSTILMLDNITSPGNIGAIIRSAAAFDIDCIIIHRRNTPKDLSTIIKISTGNAVFVPLIYEENILNAIHKLKDIDYWIFGLDAQSKYTLDEYNFDNHSKICIILGAEDKGIRSIIKKNCDQLIKIKMMKNVESLNVANANAIVLHSLYNRKI